MDKNKRLKLEHHGWKTGSAAEFLGLSPEEAVYVDLKVSLSRYLKEKRENQHLTQQTLAKRIHSSQSRVAKMEKGDPTVSVDLLMRSLFNLGATRREVSRIVA